MSWRRHSPLPTTWHGVRRQVRVRGSAEPVSNEAADDYWATRSRDSRIGAWASEQSAVLDSRADLERRVAAANDRHVGSEVPRPTDWGGLRVVPSTMEFWQGRPERLHDRFRYTLEGDRTWTIDRLSP